MKLTTSTLGKGAAIIGGSGAGSYGMYALATGGKTTDSKETQEETGQYTYEISPDLQKKIDTFNAESENYANISGSFGHAFGRFMLKPNEDDSKWTELEKKVKERANSGSDNSLSSEFKAVKDSGGKKLKEVCREIYGRTKTTMTIKENSQLLTDTWQFCSVVGHKLESIREADWGTKKGDDHKYKDKWASLVGNPNALLNTKESGKGKKDEKAWQHIYEKVLKLDQENTSKKNTLDQRFSSISSGEDLGKECQRAYESVKSESETDYGNNVIEYCVLDASIYLSEYPTKPST